MFRALWVERHVWKAKYVLKGKREHYSIILALHLGPTGCYIHKGKKRFREQMGTENIRKPFMIQELSILIMLELENV